MLAGGGTTAPVEASSMDLPVQPWEPEQPEAQETGGPGWSNIAPGPIPTSSTVTFVADPDKDQNQKPSIASRLSIPFSKNKREQKHQQQKQQQNDTTTVTPVSAGTIPATTTSHGGWDTSTEVLLGVLRSTYFRVLQGSTSYW
mmetsp:Transcript_22680/g.53677  ORF Transcript_22680/g.53677 Transcript_22680/m.53677 type:complete len:143 (+) Transcript_22680:774-1202(+)